MMTKYKRIVENAVQVVLDFSQRPPGSGLELATALPPGT